jgi:hypothetical protein
MIIRIIGGGQYQVSSCLLDDLNEIDNRIVEHVSKGNEESYRRDLARLISSIKQSGKPVDAEDIIPSDIVVPPEDLTFEEARRVFSGQGLIED